MNEIYITIGLKEKKKPESLSPNGHPQHLQANVARDTLHLAVVPRCPGSGYTVPHVNL